MEHCRQDCHQRTTQTTLRILNCRGGDSVVLIQGLPVGMVRRLHGSNHVLP